MWLLRGKYRKRWTCFLYKSRLQHTSSSYSIYYFKSSMNASFSDLLSALVLVRSCSQQVGSEMPQQGYTMGKVHESMDFLFIYNARNSIATLPPIKRSMSSTYLNYRLPYS